MQVERHAQMGIAEIIGDGFSYVPGTAGKELDYQDSFVITETIDTMGGKATATTVVRISRTIGAITRDRDSLGRAPELCGQPSGPPTVVVVPTSAPAAPSPTPQRIEMGGRACEVLQNKTAKELDLCPVIRG